MIIADSSDQLFSNAVRHMYDISVPGQPARNGLFGNRKLAVLLLRQDRVTDRSSRRVKRACNIVSNKEGTFVELVMRTRRAKALEFCFVQGGFFFPMEKLEPLVHPETGSRNLIDPMWHRATCPGHRLSGYTEEGGQGPWAASFSSPLNATQLPASHRLGAPNLARGCSQLSPAES